MNASSSSAAVSDAGDQPRLFGLAWAHFLNDGAANYLPGVLPAILVAMNLSVSYAGVLMAALIMGQALQPLIGLVADRIGGRGFIVVGLACSSLGGALVGLMPGYASLVCLLMFIGVSNSVFHPQALAAARHVGGRRHGASMSVFLVGGEIGRGAWPLVAGWLVTARGLDALWLLSLPALFTLPLLWRWAPPLPPRGPKAAPLNLRSHGGPMTRLVAFASLRSIMIYSVITFMPVLWHNRGGSLAGGASFVTVLLLVGIIGNLAGGRLADRAGRRPVLGAAIAASALLLAGFILSEGVIAWALLSLLGITLFATLPLTVLIGQDIFPDNRSLGSGLALGLSNALAALSIMALGPAAAAWGAYAALWITVGCGLAALPLAFTLPESEVHVPMAPS